MIICHCALASDRAIRSAIHSGARSCKEIAEHCGAGANCGGCRPAVEELLREHESSRFVVLRLAQVAITGA